jgi:hypothetical protein
MREFASAFGKGLFRGLRAFPSPLRDAEELVECHNLAPSEHSLRGRDSLVPIGFSAPFVEYIGVRDQGGITWYWTTGPDLVINYDTTVPNATTLGYNVVALTPSTTPYWLQVDAVDVPATQLYIFPSELTGDLLVNTVAPPVGAGYDVGANFVFRSMSGWRHRLMALTTLDVLINRVGE